MIQDLKQQKGRPLDRAYLIDAFDFLHRDDEDKSPDAVFGRRWELVGELVNKCMPDLTDKQVARLGAKLLWIAEKDTPEKLEADLQRWLHESR